MNIAWMTIVSPEVLQGITDSGDLCEEDSLDPRNVEAWRSWCEDKKSENWGDGGTTTSPSTFGLPRRRI